VIGLPGVEFGRLARHPDSRGSFAEAWRATGGSGREPFPGVQANLSSSNGGVLRGLHFHRRQADRWIVLTGRAFVALVDVRPKLADPASAPLLLTSVLGPDETVTIPAGVAHGFLATEPLELLYIVTNEYDGSDELGFAWDDPETNIEWPTSATNGEAPILSDRDMANPPLSELIARLRQEQELR
jgi:dTDP-4-dehydrorhamnose 3,5-epimerase